MPREAGFEGRVLPNYFENIAKVSTEVDKGTVSL